MGKLNDTARTCSEEAVRAAMDRLLRGELPPDGRWDLKSLATGAGVARTGFYSKRDRDGTVREGPYQHLAQEFERRLNAVREAGAVLDPRDAQIERLKAENSALKARIAFRDTAVDELTAFKEQVLSRLAAQHDWITHLRGSQSEPKERGDGSACRGAGPRRLGGAVPLGVLINRSLWRRW